MGFCLKYDCIVTIVLKKYVTISLSKGLSMKVLTLIDKPTAFTSTDFLIRKIHRCTPEQIDVMSQVSNYFRYFSGALLHFVRKFPCESVKLPLMLIILLSSRIDIYIIYILQNRCRGPIKGTENIITFRAFYVDSWRTWRDPRSSKWVIPVSYLYVLQYVPYLTHLTCFHKHARSKGVACSGVITHVFF